MQENFGPALQFKTPTQELPKKNHGLLTLAPSPVQSVKTRSFAALLQSFIAVFHILFH
jgi:hypothetical protein